MLAGFAPRGVPCVTAWSGGPYHSNGFPDLRSGGHGVPTLRVAFRWTRNAHPAYILYSTAFTIDSITFFASPNTIIVFGW